MNATEPGASQWTDMRSRVSVGDGSVGDRADDRRSNAATAGRSARDAQVHAGPELAVAFAGNLRIRNEITTGSEA